MTPRSGRMELDLTPDTHMLESIRNADDFSPRILIGEAIDNSLDARATDVDITIDRANGQIIIVDNGDGISYANAQKFMKLGGHAPTDSTKLGYYGVGIKSQSLAAGDLLSIRSTHAQDGSLTLDLNWDVIVKSKVWRTVSIWDAYRKSPHRTMVKISGLHRSLTEKDEKDIIDEIATTFRPALKPKDDEKKRLIFVNGLPVAPAPDPALQGEIKEGRKEFVVGKKKAIVRAALLADPMSTDHGIVLSYGHRIIQKKCSIGLRGRSTVGIYVNVHLTGDWKLGTFKNKIVQDPHQRELSDFVADVIDPLLDVCESIHRSDNIRDMIDRLNDSLPPELAVPSRPRQTQRLNRQGPKRKEKKGRPYLNSVESSTGVTTLPGTKGTRSNNAGRLDFDIVPLESGVGAFVPGAPDIVQLNMNDGWISTLLNAKGKDREMAEMQLYGIAIGIYLHAVDLKELKAAQPHLKLEGTFEQRWQSLMDLKRSRMSDKKAA